MKTDCIIPRVEIVGHDFRSFTFGEVYSYKKLEWKYVDLDKAFHAYFSGTCKIFVMICYEFQTLLIIYIHLLKIIHIFVFR